ncbi:alanine racemase [Anaerotignum lactatifermentans]|uniref:Alanine racemase n=1 Tax=Anaerotignum lactatifermentans TaxID=160404 RepID=A0ABS2G890_9FIRM|nr:alanine racemase [Anaerotignum lactatifermentans]MBM6828143.1 alanine racemase [Anaerotignum lactatifermentans]MBM6876694.1 alanine racemase [Anaerotignum lactatifermentans]MBM6949726.1 alanine racemase [Anaerotignum lactatifermentans]
MKLPEQYITTPTPFYAYHKKDILSQAEKLNDLSVFEILYSVKTNPFLPILETMAALGYGADAASAAEVLQCRRSGIPAEKIYYSAPGKTKEDLLQTWRECHLIADSFHELELCQEIALQKQQSLSAGLRINPPFSMGGGEGTPSKFGIDWEQLRTDIGRLGALSQIRINGLHIHLRSQVLSAQTLIDYYRDILELALEMEHLLGNSLDYINFGSGIGIIYDQAQDPALDLTVLKESLLPLIASYRPRLKAKFLLESGRFLVGACGNYVTEIVDIKVSHGKTYYIVKNGANGFFRPVLKELLLKDGGHPAAAEPFYTHSAPCRISLLAEGGKEISADIVGHLCTAQDVMASNICLPQAKIGDRIVFSHAGSYGYSLSPLLFASQPMPAQIWLEEDSDR